ncbi:TolC family protein [candidate division KSB1 bacterium]|nr:TolC family protein [candidate division KSB1 bacterium]
MKLMTMHVLLACMLFVGTQNGFSQETMSLTIEQSVAIALDKNPDIQIAEKQLKKAGAQVWESYANLLPSVDGSINYQHAWDLQTNIVPNFLKSTFVQVGLPGAKDLPDYLEFSFGLENTLNYGMQLKQPLFLGGAGIAGVRIAHAAHYASEQQLELKKQQLVYNTVNAFYGCLLAQELVRVQEEALDQAEANYQLVVKKYDAGSASGFDKMRAQVEVANLKPGLINARNNYQAALTGLRTVMGLPKDTQLKILGELSFEADEYEGVQLEEFQNRAFVNRPELMGLKAQKKIASNGVSIARSELLPKIFFATDYSFMEMRNDNKFRHPQASKGFTSAISLQMPIFQSFKRMKQYQQATLDYRITLDSEKQLRDGIIADVEISYNKYLETRGKYTAAKESIQLAEEALRLANLTYEEGASTQLDVMNSQLALTRAKLNYASALYEYQMARYGLRRATGTLKGVL